MRTGISTKNTLNRPWAPRKLRKYPEQGLAQQRTYNDGRNSSGLGVRNWERLQREEGIPVEPPPEIWDPHQALCLAHRAREGVWTDELTGGRRRAHCVTFTSSLPGPRRCVKFFASFTRRGDRSVEQSSTLLQATRLVRSLSCLAQGLPFQQALNFSGCLFAHL